MGTFLLNISACGGWEQPAGAGAQTAHQAWHQVPLLLNHLSASFLFCWHYLEEYFVLQQLEKAHAIWLHPLLTPASIRRQDVIEQTCPGSAPEPRPWCLNSTSQGHGSQCQVENDPEQSDGSRKPRVCNEILLEWTEPKHELIRHQARRILKITHRSKRDTICLNVCF